MSKRGPRRSGGGYLDVRVRKAVGIARQQVAALVDLDLERVEPAALLGHDCGHAEVPALLLLDGAVVADGAVAAQHLLGLGEERLGRLGLLNDQRGRDLQRRLDEPGVDHDQIDESATRRRRERARPSRPARRGDACPHSEKRSVPVLSSSTRPTSALSSAGDLAAPEALK